MNYSILKRHITRTLQDLLLEATTPAEVMTKIGIKKGSIPDVDFDKIMNSGLPRQQWVYFVKYYQQCHDIDLIMKYAEILKRNKPTLDLTQYPTFTAFTEELDAMDYQKGNNKSSSSNFSIESTPPDTQSSDGRYKVYDAADMGDCIKYGKGYTFCISRAGGNMYGYYRTNQESKYYFLFDTKLSPDDNKYITVVDAHPNGKFEFTHRDNNTNNTSEKYNYSLDDFCSTKPGLSEIKSIFKANPISDAERQENKYFNEVNNSFNFKSLSPVNKIKFIRTGQYDVPEQDFDGLSKELKNEYINLGKFVSVESLAKLGEPLQRIWLKSAIDNGVFVDVKYFNVLVDSIKIEYLKAGRYISTESLAKLSEPLQRIWLKSAIDNGKTTNRDDFNVLADSLKIEYIKAGKAISTVSLAKVSEPLQHAWLKGVIDNSVRIHIRRFGDLSNLSPEIQDLIVNKKIIFVKYIEDFRYLPQKYQNALITPEILKNAVEDTVSLDTFEKLTPELKAYFINHKAIKLAFYELSTLNSELQASFINHDLVSKGSKRDLQNNNFKPEIIQLLRDKKLINNL